MGVGAAALAGEIAAWAVVNIIGDTIDSIAHHTWLVIIKQGSHFGVLVRQYKRHIEQEHSRGHHKHQLQQEKYDGDLRTETNTNTKNELQHFRTACFCEEIMTDLDCWLG